MRPAVDENDKLPLLNCVAWNVAVAEPPNAVSLVNVVCTRHEIIDVCAPEILTAWKKLHKYALKKSATPADLKVTGTLN